MSSDPGEGPNTLELEHHMWRLLDARRAEFPAEHNFGHLYYAKSELINHYKSLDPCNCFNAGVGRTSKRTRWHDAPRRVLPPGWLDAETSSQEGMHQQVAANASSVQKTS